MIKAGQKVHVKFAGLSFTGKVTRVGAEKGEKTKIQIQNQEGGKPLWYPLSAVAELEDKEEKVYTFTFAGAKKKGTVVERKDGKVVMKSIVAKEGNYPVKESDVEWGDDKSDFEKAIDESIERNKDAIQEKQGEQEGGKPEKQPKNDQEPEDGQEEVKTTVLGECIVRFLQNKTEQKEEVDCKSITEISEGVGKTQPQIQPTLKSLSDLGLVMIDVCGESSCALTPSGFSYKCGNPVDLQVLTKDGKKVTKKERIIALYHQGLTNRQITDTVGCDPSYPSWLIKEEIAKGNIKPRS